MRSTVPQRWCANNRARQRRHYSAKFETRSQLAIEGTDDVLPMWCVQCTREEMRSLLTVASQRWLPCPGTSTVARRASPVGTQQQRQTAALESPVGRFTVRHTVVARASQFEPSPLNGASTSVCDTVQRKLVRVRLRPRWSVGAVPSSPSIDGDRDNVVGCASGDAHCKWGRWSCYGMSSSSC